MKSGSINLEILVCDRIFKASDHFIYILKKGIKDLFQQLGLALSLFFRLLKVSLFRTGKEFTF
jgi:hypothetical protein